MEATLNIETNPDPLGVNRNPKVFTESERTNAITVLDSASRYFGHGTLRFILLGMIDFNDDVSLRIIKRVGVWDSNDGMLNRMYHVGYVPPRGDYYRKSGNFPYSPISTGFFQNLMAIYFGAVFLDSHICFRMEDNKKWTFTDRYNSYILPKGPVIIPDVEIFGTSQREVSWKIALELAKTYKKVHGSALEINKKKLFVEKQVNLINIFETLLWRQVLNDPDIPTEKKFSLMFKFINEIRADLLNFEAKGGLLKQFYAFLDSKSAFGYVKLRNGYKLHLELDQFQGKDIVRWHGLHDALRPFGEFKRNNIIPSVIKDLVEPISNLILDVGGEVEIFPLLYINDIQGYKGYVNTYYKAIPNSFSIDLENEGSLYLLDYMGNLMLGYPVIFIVSEKGSTWKNNRVLFAFNQGGFVKLEEIFSKLGGGSSKGRRFNSRYPVVLSNSFPDPNNPGQYITFYDRFPDPSSLIYTSFFEKYNLRWTFLPIGITTGSNSEFFTYYFDKIISGTTDYEIAIKRVLGILPP